MPFLTKCQRCGWITTAKTNYVLRILQKEHDISSHKDNDSEAYDFCTWTTAVISQKEYDGLQLAMQNPKFWLVIRRNPALIQPLFSGLRSGEN
jgi:hypothetical protein